MAQVLAAVSTAGLNAVLVAVEFVIESGALIVEHVENVLDSFGSAERCDGSAAGQLRLIFNDEFGAYSVNILRPTALRITAIPLRNTLSGSFPP